MKKKLLASLLAVTMLVSLFPVSALALETEETGLCPHHLEHTAECGCIVPSEASPGQPCGYVSLAVSARYRPLLTRSRTGTASQRTIGL